MPNYEYQCKTCENKFEIWQAVGEAAHVGHLTGVVAFVEHADQKEQGASRQAMIDHLHVAAGDTLGVEREQAERAKAKVGHAAIGDQSLDVGLREGAEAAVYHADDREDCDQRDAEAKLKAAYSDEKALQDRRVSDVKAKFTRLLSDVDLLLPMDGDAAEKPIEELTASRLMGFAPTNQLTVQVDLDVTRPMPDPADGQSDFMGLIDPNPRREGADRY